MHKFLTRTSLNNEITQLCKLFYGSTENTTNRAQRDCTESGSYMHLDTHSTSPFTSMSPSHPLQPTHPSPLSLAAVIPVKGKAQPTLHHCAPLGHPHCHTSPHLPLHRVQHHATAGLCCSQHSTAIDWIRDPALDGQEGTAREAEGEFAGVLGGAQTEQVEAIRQGMAGKNSWVGWWVWSCSEGLRPASVSK